MIVVWRVTERCNLSCPFCAYDRRLAAARREANVPSVERFGRVLGEYRRLTGARVMVSWLGGEPFLWPDLIPVSRRLHDEFDVAISATTNGTTLGRPDVQAAIVETFAELTVSVDGFADFHERMRGWRSGWTRLRASVEALASARAAAGSRLKLRANIVVMRDNLADFAALCETLADWGMDEITFNQLGGRDRPEFFPAHRLRPADVGALRAMVPALQTRLAGRGVHLCASGRYLDRIEATAHDRRLPVLDCAPGEDFLFIDELGRVAPCSFTAVERGVPIESIASGADLLALPGTFARQPGSRLEGACADCASTRVFDKFGA